MVEPGGEERKEFFVDSLHYTKKGILELADNYADYIVENNLVQKIEQASGKTCGREKPGEEKPSSSSFVPPRSKSEKE